LVEWKDPSVDAKIMPTNAIFSSCCKNSGEGNLRFRPTHDGFDPLFTAHVQLNA